jgi:hypothetical protein
MGNTFKKSQIIQLPAQSGKTRKMQEFIKEYDRLNEEDDTGLINVVICSNNSNLVQQTVKRMQDEVYTQTVNIHDESDEKYTIVNENDQYVFSWLAESNRDYKSIACDILSDEIRMLVCCAHAKRLQHLSCLLDRLNDLYTKKRITKKLNIWIDEADMSISLWSKYDESVHNLDIVNKITLVSATMDSILKQYKKLNIMPFENTHQDTYLCLQDCTFQEYSMDGCEDALGYVKKVMEETIEPVGENFILYAPGDVNRESHRRIAKYLRDTRGFGVAVINSELKAIYTADRRKISLTNESNDPFEIGKEIKKIYYENGLNENPFAITGNICIGRGITFQSEEFIFDMSIIPNMKNKATLYQSSTRAAGNIKQVIGNKEPIICCTRKTWKVITDKENCAINLAKLVYQEKLQYADRHTFKRATDESVSDFQYTVYDTFEEVENFGKTIGHQFRVREDGCLAPAELLQNGENPSVEYLIDRKWGINKKTSVRVIPTNNNKFFVCWDANVHDK